MLKYTNIFVYFLIYGIFIQIKIFCYCEYKNFRVNNSHNWLKHKEHCSTCEELTNMKELQSVIKFNVSLELFGAQLARNNFLIVANLKKYSVSFSVFL